MNNKKTIVADKNLIAFCGLYCGACNSYLKGKCSGCKEKENANWCNIRKCCLENNYQSCADCKIVELKDCKKFNNFIGKIFGMLFNSNRTACIAKVRENGYEAYAIEMTERKQQSLPKK